MSKKNNNSHVHFLSLIVLISGFSLYTLFSFHNSTNKYIDNLYADVTSIPVTVGSSESGSQLISQVDVPSQCATCPDVQICSSVCPDGSSNSGENYQIFTDLDSSHPNAMAIESMYNLGVIGGYPDGSFGPDNTLNRAELAKILVTAVDADLAGGPYENCFTDVTLNDWYVPFVCFAKTSGWVNGYSDGSYRPAQTITRAESLKMVMEAFDYEIPESISETPFSDISTSDWFAVYAVVAHENSIIGGTTFDPNSEITRKEFVQIVYNAMYYSGRIGGI